MTKRERRSTLAGRRRWLVTEVRRTERDTRTKSTALRRKLVSFPFQKAGCKNISSWWKQLEEHFFHGNRPFVYPIHAQRSFRNFSVSRITRLAGNNFFFFYFCYFSPIHDFARLQLNANPYAIPLSF